MSYFDIVILGYIVNLVVFTGILVFLLVNGLLYAFIVREKFIFEKSKADVYMADVKSKMSEKQHSQEKMYGICFFAFPFAMLLKVFRLGADFIIAKGDFIGMYMLKIKRLEDKYL